MKTNPTNIFMRNKNILYLALAVGLILLLPLAAMQFSEDVNWSGFDFVFAGALLFGAGLAFELIARRLDLAEYRSALGLAIGAALLLLWINLAVGIIGSEDNPVNALYLGVPALLGIGSLVVQFRPLGMSRVLFATALAQALVTLIAWFTEHNLQVIQVLVLNAFFIALWVGSALLFQRAHAASTRNPAP